MTDFRINFMAGPELGLGHYSRAKILGRALSPFGAVDLCWVNGTGDPANPLSEPKVFEQPHAPLSDLAEVEIFDGRLFSNEDFKRVRDAGAKCVVIDDTGGGVFDADLVLCHQPGIDEADYHLPDSARVMTGPGVALIDPGFYAARRVGSNGPSLQIFISFGGVDPLRMTERVAIALGDIPNLNLKILLGPYRAAPAVTEISPKTIQVLQNLTAAELAVVIQLCDIGIVSASTLAMECCAAKLPTLVFATTPDQIPAEQRLTAAGLVVGGGNAVSMNTEILGDRIRGFIGDPGSWPKIAGRCEALFDTIGVDRAAAAINACRLS